MAMMFVDGENLTIRAQEYMARVGIDLPAGDHFLKDIFVWIPGREPNLIQQYLPWSLGESLSRSYYYTSLVGDDEKLLSVRQHLRALHFDPQVFKRFSGQTKSKGVDITLSKDMLSHAFEDHYRSAVLVAGDADYVPLIDEVKRRGKNVYVAFFAEPSSGLSPEVRLRADGFWAIDDTFAALWRERLERK